MGYYYYYSSDDNNDEFTDEDYYYSANSIFKFLDNFKKDNLKNMDFCLESYNYYEHPMDVKKRNMEKFDRLTELGYKLNLVTGEFKLSS